MNCCLAPRTGRPPVVLAGCSVLVSPLVPPALVPVVPAGVTAAVNPTLDYEPPTVVRQRTGPGSCVVCFDDAPAGVRCDYGHFTCADCLGTLVQVKGNDLKKRLKSQGGFEEHIRVSCSLAFTFSARAHY